MLVILSINVIFATLLKLIKNRKGCKGGEGGIRFVSLLINNLQRVFQQIY